MNKEYYRQYEPEAVCTTASITPQRKFFAGMELDDLLILALIIIMLTEEEPDFVSILILAFLFFN